MLCERCRSILLTAKSSPPGTWNGIQPQLFEYPDLGDAWGGSHHVEPGEFLEAFRGTCYICSTIHRDCSSELRLQAHWFRTFYQLRLISSQGPSQPSEDHYELEFTIEVLPEEGSITKKRVSECNGTFKILPKREVQATGEPLKLTNNTFDGQCKDQIRDWLSNCRGHHKLCKQDWRTRRNFPSRLLNLGTEGQVFLESFEHTRRRPQYATLSHCWQAGITSKLTMQSLLRLKKGLPVTDLSRNFQDAISIAIWMDLKYLWIDALCIIQDSAEDWLKESTRMGDIYAHSYCNIAATSAQPNKGCFTQRHTEMVEPYTIPNPQSDDPSQLYVIGYDDFWSNSLLDTMLHTRGWVLQERLLSPRTIHFGQEQMFWECRCIMACEAYPQGIPEQFKNWRTRTWRQSDDMLNPANKASSAYQDVSRMLWRYVSKLVSSVDQKQACKEPTWAYTIWSKTIERYMECKVSYDKDKLVAISGIAQKLAELTQETYLAGMWYNEKLPQSLLWRVLGRSQADNTPSIRTPSANLTGYRAPSWSWASVEAKIIWDWPADCIEVLVDITDVRVQESAGSNMSSIDSAEMNVRGYIQKAEIFVASRGDDGTWEEDGRYTLRVHKDSPDSSSFQQQARIEPHIHLDTPMLPNASSVETYLLPVCRGWKGRSAFFATDLAGLLLKKSDGVAWDNHYERIGIFGLDRTQAEALYGAGVNEGNAIESHFGNSEKSNITLI